MGEGTLRSILVTGSGSGIGKAIARRLAVSIMSLGGERK